MLAGKLLEEKRPHLYWTPCVTHYIDLMLEDIGKLPLIKKTIQTGVSLVVFNYSHFSTLTLLRQNVVRVITNNGSNYMLVGKLLEEKRPHLYWTPCVSHCIDLMVEDIGKLPLIKKTIQTGVSLVVFIYSHSDNSNRS